MAGAVLRGLAGILSRHWGKAAIVSGGAYMYRDEIAAKASEVSENPEETIETIKDATLNAGETVKSTANKVGETLDGAKDKIEGAFNFAQDPTNAVIDKIKSEAEEGFDLATAGKWLAVIVGGGWLVSKIFGGKDEAKEGNSSSGFPWGTALLIAGAVTAYLNRDNIMDMAKGVTNSNNEINHMDPSAFDMG